MIGYVNNIEKIFSIKKHVLLASSYRHYLLSLSDIQKKGELKMMDNRGNDISYSYVLSRDRYKKIYNEINEGLTDILLGGNKVSMGRCGCLYIIGIRKVMTISKAGKLYKGHMGVNWQETVKLWKELYPDVEQKIIKGCINISYKHIYKKPLVYYDDKYTYKLYWDKKGSSATGVKYYDSNTTCSLKKKISAEARRYNDDGVHIAAKIYDAKSYRNISKRSKGTIIRGVEIRN